MGGVKEYLKSDVDAVSRALLGSAFSFNEAGRNAYAFCVFCNQQSYIDWQDGQEGAANDRIEHKADCPVLIAKDLLT